MKTMTTVEILHYLRMFLCLMSVVMGFLAFSGHTMDLRLAFWSIIGVLVAIALKP